MTDKILFVDDEPAILDAYARLLRREFDVNVSVGGLEGLESIRKRGPYSVVISDMRMPGMSGAQFLAKAREYAPNTVRMLLTGYSDLSATMEAVNEGHIFRFLTKPCEKELLVTAITAGVEQYKLVTAEKDLLENTLMGSIKVLTDVLSATSPEAFGRSMRLARYVRHMVATFKLPSPWRFEAAAMLSQLGCLTLDPDLMQSAYMGNKLSPEDQARFDAHPEVARSLLAHIPRLEPIAWMISQQLTKDIPAIVPGMPAASAEPIVFGARILKLAVAFDNLRTKAVSESEALARLRTRRTEFEPKLLEALTELRPIHAKMELRQVDSSDLATGMILGQDMTNTSGMLMLAKGQEITPAILSKIRNLADARMIDKEVMAFVPV